jgi:hypothetical protein
MNRHLRRLAAWLCLSSAHAASNVDLAPVFEAVDSDGSGCWSAAEYASVEQHVSSAPVFAAADANGDGMLAPAEVEAAFPKGGWGGRGKLRKALLALPVASSFAAGGGAAAAVAAAPAASAPDGGTLSYTAADGTVKTLTADEAEARLAASPQHHWDDAGGGVRLVRPGVGGAIALGGKGTDGRKRELVQASVVRCKPISIN